MQTETQTEKRGKGRPKGSNSFVTVSLDELTKMFQNGDQIQVGRLWLQSKKPKQTTISVQQSSPVAQQTTEQPVVEMQLED